MCKQLIALGLILMVNVLFLGHSVIHHHHEGIPHVTFHDQAHDGNASSCEDEDDYCSHAPVEHDRKCSLEKEIDVICKVEKDIHAFICCDSGNHPGLLWQAILLYYTCDLSVLATNEGYRIPPYLIDYLSADVNRIYGLRAPPVLLS